MALLSDLIDLGERCEATSRDYFAKLSDVADAEAHARISRIATSSRDTSHAIAMGIVALSKSARTKLSAF
jgi:hypothetical protein